MQSAKKAVGYGLLVWIIPSGGFFLVVLSLGITEWWTIFESIITYLLLILLKAGITIIFSRMYFQKVKHNFLKEGLLLGLLWFVMSISFDILLLLFSVLPKLYNSSDSSFLSPLYYLSILSELRNLPLIYLSIPAVTVLQGHLLQKRYHH